MLQITAEISALTTEQREAFAAFILSFPTVSLQNIYKSQDTEHEEAVTIAPFTIHVDEEDESPTPEQVFAPAPPAGPQLVPPPPSAPVAAADDTLDKAGLPFDARIHAGSRVKTADGLWRKRRGVADSLVNTVEAELKALMAVPAAAPVAAVPPPPPAPVAEVAAVPPPPPAPVATVDRSAFVALITKITAARAANKITMDEVTAALNGAGVPALPLLSNRLDLVPQVETVIDTFIASRG